MDGAAQPADSEASVGGLSFFQNARLTLGLLTAWILSALGMVAWIRHLPSLVVLGRRRMRRAVLDGRRPAVTQTDPKALWRQNNALPGNRVDGFRFNYLVVLIVLTPLYLWLELSYGVNLLDKMGSDTPTEETDAIEHWGRLISGLAVALLFLKDWFAYCEKWGRSWWLRVTVSIVICLLALALTWKIQDTVIDFYVRRAAAEVSLSLAVLVSILVLGMIVIRTWLDQTIVKRRTGLFVSLFGLSLIVSLGAVLVTRLDPLIDTVIKHVGVSEQIVQDLGRERQQAATLTLVRRSMQQGVYRLETLPIPPEAIASAEGKAALALFPIVGSTMDQARFIADRPQLVFELMLDDWDQQYGNSTFSAFADAELALQRMYDGAYSEGSAAYTKELARNGRAAAEAVWRNVGTKLLDSDDLQPGLTRDAFLHHPAAARYLRQALACFDCEFIAGMPREAVVREVFKWTQAHNVRQSLDRLESSEYFQKGHDGEVAARTYWVPIWALLFSMIGAFTHIFKMFFTLTEYVQRRAFHAAKAADSPLAHTVVRYSKILIAFAVAGLALFIFFSDNRVTGNERYLELRRTMWVQQPIVGAIATHWTINAQGMIYPFTRKIRPSWLDFDSDPMDWLPFVKHADDEHHEDY